MIQLIRIDQLRIPMESSDCDDILPILLLHPLQDHALRWFEQEIGIAYQHGTVIWCIESDLKSALSALPQVLIRKNKLNLGDDASHALFHES